MTSPDTARHQIKNSVETMSRIRYGAVIYGVTQEQFAKMVVAHFFAENKQEVNELAESLMHHPEDYPDIIARINGQVEST